MKTVAVISAKGGVGKTTVTTNLAAAWRQVGRPVLIVDLDPQNAVAAYLGVEGEGGLEAVQSTALDWYRFCPMAANGVHVLPYGQRSEDGREQFEQRLRQQPGLLAALLRGLDLPQDTLVLLDTPPGPSVYLRQALAVADLALVVLLSDAGSYATIPQIRGLLQSYRPDHGHEHVAWIVNQVDVARDLNRDVLERLRHQFGNRLVGRIHEDQAVAEATASQETVLAYAANSQATADFLACVDNVTALLEPTAQRLAWR